MIGSSTRGMLDFGVQDQDDGDSEQNDLQAPTRQHSDSVHENMSCNGSSTAMSSHSKKNLQNVLRVVVRKRSKASLISSMMKMGKNAPDAEEQGSTCFSDVVPSSASDKLAGPENVQIKSGNLLRKEPLRSRSGKLTNKDPTERGLSRSTTMPDFRGDQSAPRVTKAKKKVIKVRVCRSDEHIRAPAQRSKSPFRMSCDVDSRSKASTGRDWGQEYRAQTGTTNASPPRRRSIRTAYSGGTNNAGTSNAGGTKNGTAYTGGTRNGRDRFSMGCHERDIFIDFGAQDSVSSLGLSSITDSPSRGVTRTVTTALSNMVDTAAASNPRQTPEEISRPRGLTRSRTLPAAAVIERKDSWKRQMITLEPGVSLPLRGNEETMEALSRNDFIQFDCTACETFLHCISSAEFVLCSVCRSISKVESGSEESQSRSQKSIGLGLTVEDLCKQTS